MSDGSLFRMLGVSLRVSACSAVFLFHWYSKRYEYRGRAFVFVLDHLLFGSVCWCVGG